MVTKKNLADIVRKLVSHLEIAGNYVRYVWFYAFSKKIQMANRTAMKLC